MTLLGGSRFCVRSFQTSPFYGSLNQSHVFLSSVPITHPLRDKRADSLSVQTLAGIKVPFCEVFGYNAHSKEQERGEVLCLVVVNAKGMTKWAAITLASFLVDS
jgi:hypothetical protein